MVRLWDAASGGLHLAFRHGAGVLWVDFFFLLLGREGGRCRSVWSRCYKEKEQEDGGEEERSSGGRGIKCGRCAGTAGSSSQLLILGLGGQVGRVSPRVVGYPEALPRSSGGARRMDEAVSIQAHQRTDLRLGGGRAEKVGEASIMLADDGVCA